MQEKKKKIKCIALDNWDFYSRRIEQKWIMGIFFFAHLLIKLIDYIYTWQSA